MRIGSRQYAVSNTSTFFTQELPNLKNVTKLTVFLLHTSNFYNETCSNGASLKTLEKILKNKNIEYECKDNGIFYSKFICSLSSKSAECSKLNVYFARNY